MIEELKRYECGNNGYAWCQGCYCMNEEAEGDYVKYDDVMHLLAAPPAEIARATPADQEPVDTQTDRALFESALSELVNKIDTGLDSGDLLTDAGRASTAINSILSGGDLVACAHEYFRDSGDRYEKSVEFRIGWNACLDAIGHARKTPQPPQSEAQSVRDAGLEQAAAVLDRRINGWRARRATILNGQTVADELEHHAHLIRELKSAPPQKPSEESHGNT